MIAVNLLPLSFTTSSGFRNFMELVEPSYKAPSITTLKSRMSLLHEQLKEKVTFQLNSASAVALTSDCWTSRAQDSYITVTAHTLNYNWKPQSFALATEEMDQRHTAENLMMRMQQVISYWNLDCKVTAVVTDNAVNGTNAVEGLPSLLESRDLTCSAHSLHLSVNKGMNIHEIESLCRKAGKLVAHFKHSTIASDGLSRRQEQLGLLPERLTQSCPTRWNSTYQMLTKLIKNRPAIESVLVDRTVVTAKVAQNLEICEQEWDTIRELCDVLEPLHLATTVLCSDTASPVSMVRPVMRALMVKLEPQFTDDPLVGRFKEVVRLETVRPFSMEWDPRESAVSARQRASFLDPRYKDLQCEEPSARQEIRTNIMNLLRDTTPSVGEDGASTSQPQATALDRLFNTQSSSSDLSAQFEAYLSEPQLGHNLDALKWWRDHESKFPAVAQLAMKYMCIPASSASSERVFSTAGNIVTAKRSCLLPENVSSLVFLYQNRSYFDS
ncbi:E3 SUMO-protein ligase ZBED1-like [Ixodes scapularis]|uniref:E3 SUMO-protein ligase ZBED1-like n=1 Tax=Ixodes scapularis TaxID=6945 RepID=UPI001A9F524B|nr:E3 SUMO-protein ligase ZBED1-like [Ixodes scapularis]